MYIFNSRTLTLTVVLRPSRKVVIGTQVIAEPGAKAEFQNGIFTTDSDEVAELLRGVINKQSMRDIVEITSEDFRAFAGRKQPSNIRTPTSAAETSSALNTTKISVKHEDPAPLKCVICDKFFKSQRDLNMHLLSHRSEVKISVELEAAPSMAEKNIEDTPAT